jgi:hypothetical protein
MPIFLTQNDIYRMIQRELPEGAYPDGPPSAFFSTADSFATAKTLGTAYSNLGQIYDNYFPQHCDSSAIVDWEELVLGMQQDQSLTLSQRQDRVVSRIRSQRRTTPPDILSIVYSVIDSSIPAEIVEWGCDEGGWVLDVSQLDIETILNGFSGVQFGFRTDWCSVTAAQLGISQQDYLNYRQEAYTYDVRIYGYTLTALQRQILDLALSEGEPARSAHVIVDGLNPADMIGGST